ncbi:thiolase family protein [Halodesulfurarchaeum sp. HSR-GB]|uniref:thiolase family protein n=1 Tax=Halodesulfurarchaeum sp. HSR-GB TaxID=3074077 RepID=UPI0028560CFE|nr:thiolase family protein [Halodesulfurarchaeum sp. HSR-GB]MDR5657588.1 thiolase family protein [Halodesulfurarchaeum sp. HSR-GB]
MPDPSLIGTGATQFGSVLEDESLQGKTFEEIAADAAFQAMDDANIEPEEIDAFYVGNMLQSTSGVSSHATVLADWLGLQQKAGFHFDTACSTGNTGLGIAHDAIKSESYENVLVVGAEITSSRPTSRFQLDREPIDPQELWYLTDIGVDNVYAYMHAYDVATAYGAIPSMAFAEKHDLSEDELDEVMFHVNRIAREHASKTPKAAVEESLEDLAAAKDFEDPQEFWRSKNNPFFAWPTRQLSALQAVDGASASIISANPSDFTDKVTAKIRGYDWRAKGFPWYGADPTRMPQDVKAFEAAYEKTGIEPADIDYLYVHDCMQIHQPILGELSGYLEDPVAAFKNEETLYTGPKPMNVSGGRHGVGHAWEASAGFETHEILQQMRGESGENQIPDEPEIAVQHNHGYGMHTAVTVLEREA